MFPVNAGAGSGILAGSPLFAAGAAAKDLAQAGPKGKRVSLGLLIYCFSLAQKARSELPDLAAYSDPIAFIQEAGKIGASAVQIPFGIRDATSIRTIRSAGEQYDVALESTVTLPQKPDDLSRFEAEMRTLRELGVQVARTVAFPGRRYEDLHTYEGYLAGVANAKNRLRLAETIARKTGVRLALENHKDQRIDERVQLLREFDSEFIGTCIDVGNNIALLEDPLEVTEALLPWALTVHFKDQGVREYEEGFLLADVPLGEGCIDLMQIVQAIRQKKPRIHLQLELITRDPLLVPILSEKYWATFPHLKAREFSRSWAIIKERSSKAQFPLVSRLSTAEKVALERQNIEKSFQFASQKLGL